MTDTQEIIDSIAATLANQRAMRNGSPPISNVLDMMPEKLRDQVMEDAEAVLKELQGDIDVRLGEIVELATDGLGNDGAHHKQWFLEEIIKKAGYSVQEIREQNAQDGNYLGDKGIAP